MFSIRDLIDVLGLPHLNKVGINYKENEFKNGEFNDFHSFSCAYDAFLRKF